MQVWINGSFVDRAEATISAFDAGLQHGVGLFETMGAAHGRVFRLDEHLDRLRDSARELRLTTRLRIDPLAEAVRRTVEVNGLERARVRITITGGDLNMLAQQGEGPQDPTILIVAQPPTEYPAAFFERGVMVTIANGRENPLDPLAGHKTIDYWRRIQALQQASQAGAGESIWFTITNHLAAGSVSNVLLVKDGSLLTPYAHGEEEAGALPAPVRPGITRRCVLELAGGLGLAIERRMLSYEDLVGAEEVMLTNSSWGVLPVVAIEKEAIGDGLVGDETRRLREAWLEAVEEETSREAV